MALLITSILSGCNIVPIKNEELAFPFGSNSGAVIEHTLDSTQTIQTPTQFNAWLDSGPKVCESTDAYGRMKYAWETLCSIVPTVCDYETVQAMNSFFSHTDKVISLQHRVRRKLGLE